MTFPTSNEVDNLWVEVKVNENNEWPSENIPNAAASESLLYMNEGTLVSVFTKASGFLNNKATMHGPKYI